MREEQLDLSTTERQLLFDIRSEMRINNELLTQLLKVLHPIARDTVQAEESKEGLPHGTLPISKGSSSGGNASRNGTEHSGKRKTVHDKQHRSTTSVLSSDDNSNGGKRVSGSGRNTTANKILSKK